MKTRYVIKFGDFYLSSLFSDSIRETFAETSPTSNEVYKWDVEQIAQDISNQYAGSEVVELNT